MKVSTNTLYIVSTPIGNLDDITFRAIKVLSNSDIILCEDTRHTAKLLNHYKIKKKLVAYHKFNEKKQVSVIIEYFKQGKILSLVSDAGTPAISDPGKILVNKCIDQKIKIVPIPGASSVTSAMSVSGFSEKFLFYGFLPKKEKELEKLLFGLSKNRFTQVFFVPAVKINFYLNKFKKYFINRKVMIAKEITKVHEEFFRQDINKLVPFNKVLKGELTVIISDYEGELKKIDIEKIINKAKKYLKKYSLKDTVDLLIENESVNKKDIYKICLKIKNEKNI